MKIHNAAWILAFAVLPAAAADAEFYGHEDAGRPEQFVAPDYPKDALSQGITGYVDVDAQVDGTLSLSDVHFRAGSPQAEAFIPGLREVAKYWLFHPAYAEGKCFPSPEQRTSFRVIYEIDGGAPRISLELERSSVKRTVKSLHPQCPAPRYPAGALRNGIIANVFARVEIRPDGTVSDVQAQAFPKEGGTERFAEEMQSTLWRCHFAATDHQDTRRFACYDAFFRLGR